MNMNTYMFSLNLLDSTCSLHHLHMAYLQISNEFMQLIYVRLHCTGVAVAQRVRFDRRKAKATFFNCTVSQKHSSPWGHWLEALKAEYFFAKI